jgi:flagellar hook assembly protein FlgD
MAGCTKPPDLSGIHPGGFKSTITFCEIEDADLAVFDVLGNKVNTLVHATLSQGSHSVEWNADNNNGVKINPGVYYIRMTAGDKVFIKTIVLINN